MLFISLQAFCQLSIFIVDNTETGFILSINGFEQNTEPEKSLAVNEVDTFPYILRVQLAEKVYFNKTVHLKQKGIHKYIITTNSRDELQLRYRGVISKLPSGISSTTLQHKIPERSLPIALYQKPKPVEPPKVKETKVEPFTTIASIPADTAKLIPPAIVVPITKSTDTLLSQIDSIPVKDGTSSTPSIVTVDSTVAEVIPINDYEVFKTKILTAEFEFEKLSESLAYAEKKPLNVEQIRFVLKQLTYDNSKMKLLETLAESYKHLPEANSLRNELEYDLTKKKFDQIITP